MARLVTTDKRKPRLEVVERRTRRRITPEEIESGLGAKRVAVIPTSGSPMSTYALRQELFRRLRSTGGRPGLDGVDMKAKVPMQRSRWKKLERLAKQVETDTFRPSPAQLASVILDRGIDQFEQTLTKTVGQRQSIESETTTVTEYVRVDQRLADLGCLFPASIAVLPQNFDTVSSRTEFLFRSEAATVRALFRNSNIPLGNILPAAERAPYIHNNSFEWLAPTIFVSAAALSEHPLAVSVALNVIGNYLTDFFRGIAGRKTVKFDIVVERKKDRVCRRINYEGDVDGLSSLADIIKRAADE
jgi:hypothetical protein